MDPIEELKQNAKRFNKIVIWGLKKRFHTHRFIHSGFYRTLKKVGVPVVWVEDEKKNQKFIEKNDLIISAEVHGKMVPKKNKFEDYNLPVREDVYYCLHNYQDILINKLNPKNFIKLQVFGNTNEKGLNDYKFNEVSFYNKEINTLFQSWGTDLLPNEFKKPVFNKNKLVFWIGSVWNNEYNQGNIQEIEELQESLDKHSIKLIKIRFIPRFLNILLTRISRLAPAIAGKFQVDVDYLPCRMFKNISYGQLGFSNVKKFREILLEATLPGDTIEEMINNALKLEKGEYISLILKQQEKIKEHTYVNNLLNIIKVFNL